MRSVRGGSSSIADLSLRQCDNKNRKQKVCITINQPDTKSNHNSNPNPNPTTKQHAIVNIQLNIVTSPPYPYKFIRDNVVAPFVLLSIVAVILPKFETTRSLVL